MKNLSDKMRAKQQLEARKHGYKVLPFFRLRARRYTFYSLFLAVILYKVLPFFRLARRRKNGRTLYPCFRASSCCFARILSERFFITRVAASHLRALLRAARTHIARAFNLWAE